MTFDKKFYEFAGDCSYLLAHDFINKHFSVMVNYENRGQKKSITMFIGDKQIELMADARWVIFKDDHDSPWSYTSGESSNRVYLSVQTHISITAGRNFLILGMMMGYELGKMAVISKLWYGFVSQTYRPHRQKMYVLKKVPMV